jgi:hypothetical protein
MCDFWARVKLRKKPIDELVVDALESIKNCDDQNAKSADDAIKEYWSIFGVRNLTLLCREEPDLCDKLKLIEQQVRSKLF